MAQQKKVIVIGAGIGGMATAVQLAQKGFSVTVYEKNSYSGGRCSSIFKEGHRFDVGATLLMMPRIYEDLYKSMGKDMYKELELYRMDPIYKIKFPGDDKMLFSSDLAFMQTEMERIEKGSYQAFLKYMSDSYKAYQISMKHIIDRNYDHALQFFNPKNVVLLQKLRAFSNHYAHTGRFFKSEMLRVVFTFQNIYVGQNPFEASAIFAMLPFLELTDGVWFPKGGMQAITKNIETIALSEGVKFEFNTPVKEIVLEGNKATGVLLKDETFVEANLVIANADLPYVYNHLLPPSKEQKRINKLHYTCSAFMFHWAMDKEYKNIEQHNVYVSGNYKKNIQNVFDEKQIPEDVSFYLHSPVKSDSSAAPQNQDSLSCIVPVGHVDDNIEQDWDKMKEQAREKVFNRLKLEGFTNFEKHIKFEICYTPKTWVSAFNLSKGATFGSLSHNLMQMGYMRPHNQHKKYRNLYFVGGSTHPGNGVPMVLLSSKLTTQKIVRNFA